MATKQLLEIKVGRDNAGAYLTLRSDFDFACIADTASPSTYLCGGVEVRRQINHPLTGNHLPFSAKWNDTGAKLFRQETINLHFLAAKNIREGVTFRLEGPVTVDKMKLFTTQLREVVKRIYAEHLKPTSFAVTMTVSETEAV